MGLTQKLGTIPLAVFTDSSNNVGIGAAASGSFKLQVTGTTNLTGALTGTSATFSSSVTANGTGGVPALNVRASDTNFALASIFGNQAGDVNWLLMSGYPNAGDFTIRQSDVVNALIIKKTTGAATFSSSVTAGGATAISDALLPIQINSGASSQAYFASNNNGSYGLLMGYDNANGYARIRNVSNTALTFETNNSEKVRITNGGNVGIGTTVPNNTANYSTLSINGTSGGQITWQTGGNLVGYAYNTASALVLGANAGNSISLDAGGSTRLTISSAGFSTFNGAITINGNFIGANTYTNYQTDGTNVGIIGSDFAIGGGPKTDFSMYAYATGNLLFYTANLQRMKISNGGQVGIGNSTPTAGLDVQFGSDASNISFRVRKADTLTTFYVRGDGFIFAPPTYFNTTGSAVNMYIDPSGIIARSTSSLKYKKDVRNYDKGLAEVMQMRSVYYKGTSEMDGDKQFAGLIAEEIEELGLNEFVQYATDGTPDALAYDHIVAILIKAIQEQQAQIEELKALIASK